MSSWKAGTAAILVLMIATYAVVGGILGYVVTYWFTGGSGWVWGSAMFLTIALIISIYSCAARPDTVLKGLNARRCTEVNEPRLYGIVRNLALAAHAPMPEVFTLDVPFPNAFALGRDPQNAMVCATYPLMDALTDEELEGVMAHELSHILHRDTVVNGIARRCAKGLSASAVAMGAIAMMGAGALGASGGRSGGGGGILFLLMFLVLVPIVVACAVMCLMLPSAGAVMRFGVSRRREYGADESAARLTGKPMALASALIKLERGCNVERNGFKDAYTANLWIVNPFGRYRKRIMCSLMDTHPSTDDRIRRLREIERELASEARRGERDG